MILINNLGYNLSLRYEGDNIFECRRFISYMISIKAYKKHKGPEWIVPASYLEEIEKNFETNILEHDWDNLGCTMKLQPYPYQKEAINYMMNNKHSLIILPPGTGKTVIAIGYVVETNPDKPIIMCTKTSLKYQWLREVEKFSNLRVKIIETPSKARKKFDSQFEDCDVYILNYETLKNDDVYNKLREYEVCGIIMDEVQQINNHKSERSKATYRFNDLETVVGMTATPITNNPLNLFGIFNMINPDVFEKYSKFSSRYIIWKFRRPVKAKNVPEMLDKVRPYIFKKDEEDVLGQLPELNILPPIICNMTNCMSTINSDIFENLDKLNVQIDKMDKANVPETDERWIKAQTNLQAYQTYAQELADDISLINTGSVYTKDYVFNDMTNPKLEALIEICSELFDSNNKVCIFTRYERMQHIIIDKLVKEFNIKVAYVNGSMDSEERYHQAIELFTNTNDYMAIVATDAMAEGTSLVTCKYLIEFEPAISYAVQTQRRGRIRRANSVSRTSYIYQLITEGSWDEIQLKSINKKKGYDDSLKDL